MNEEVREQIIELLKYLYLGNDIKKSDGILGLGSIDYKVAEKCADLYLQGYGEYIIFTGKCGKGTEGIIKQTEAEIFRNIAIKKGVPKEKIYLEKEATNTYLNYLYSDNVIKENNLVANSLIVVQKPYVERRSYAIAKQLFKNREMFITSPEFNPNLIDEYYIENKDIDLIDIVNEIVDEIDIIKKAPQFKLQIYQEIPKEIEDIYVNMINLGYNKYFKSEKIYQEAGIKMQKEIL